MDLFCRFFISLFLKKQNQTPQRTFAGQECFFSSAMEEIAVKCQPVCPVETVVLKSCCYTQDGFRLPFCTDLLFITKTIKPQCVRSNTCKWTWRQKYFDLVMTNVIVELRKETGSGHKLLHQKSCGCMLHPSLFLVLLAFAFINKAINPQIVSLGVYFQLHIWVTDV